MNDFNFKFKAYNEHGKVVVHIVIDGAEAIFRYSDADAISVIAENMQQILDYAIEDLTVREKFRDQIENDLYDWIEDVNDD